MFEPSDLDRLLKSILTYGGAAQLSEKLDGQLRRVSHAPQLVDRARELGVSPLLFDRLQRTEWRGRLAGWDQLESFYWQVAADNAVRYKRCAELLAALQEQGIRVALLKGASLALTLYGNVALRPMGDIDLLVPRDAMGEAMTVVRALGYIRADPEAQVGMSLEYENEIAYVHAEYDMAIELHWHLVDAAFYLDRVPAASLWSEMERLDVEGISVETLASPAMLVHLCAHWVLHHHFAGLRWQLDIDQLVRQQACPDWWAKVCRVAQAWQMVLPLQAALARCQRELDTPLPEGAWAMLEALRATTGETQVYRYLTAPQQSVIWRFWRELVMIQGWRRKGRYLLHHIWPDRDYMMTRYELDDQAVWPYRFYRIGRGIADLTVAVGHAVARALTGKV